MGVAQGIVILLILFLILGALTIISMTLWQQNEDWAHSMHEHINDLHDRFTEMHEHINALAGHVEDVKKIPEVVKTGIAKGAKKGREQCVTGIDGVGACVGTRKASAPMFPFFMLNRGS